MFETLTDRLNETFARLGRKGRLTEQDVDEAMREVRRALLEADVNFKVAKDFVAAVRERAVGQDVLHSLTPAQTVIGIANEELIRVLGEEGQGLIPPDRPPQILMLVGLQGSGKTTHAAKLAVHLRKQGRNPLLVAADVYRPAAINQLQALGKQISIPVYDEGTGRNPVDIAAQRAAVRPRAWLQPGHHRHRRPPADRRPSHAGAGRHSGPRASDGDPAGRRRHDRPGSGERGADVQRAGGASGLILTKMDGDARGGAALSIRAVTGVPIKFIGTGEKLDALEPFHPNRLARRILGMGDILSLIERAQETTTEEDAVELQERMLKGHFNLEDFLEQLQKVKQMGPLASSWR